MADFPHADVGGQIDLSKVNAYSEQVFDNSPLNRVERQGAPGSAWRVDATGNDLHNIHFE